ncbi:GntR family transcriptional regulator [uncultured Friedmanniella sp.]|uniref:GntR family transcriptional regulator n=1 Tax=uncultured Friedmanniella sp. TaxID=335381 RepID=UPI0035CAF828
MSSPGERVMRSSLRDQVIAVLRQRLVSGELEPGGIYSAQAVAAELGVSGSPVREAMLTLVQQGRMEPVRNRGFRVVALDDDDLRQISQLRRWLEVPAMRLLAGDPRVVAAHHEYAVIAGHIVDAAHTGNLVEYLEYDREFHLGLLDILGNDRLLEVVENLRDQTRLFGLAALGESGRLVPSAEEHAQILAAMVAGDADLTEQLMIAHLEHVTGDWAG